MGSSLISIIIFLVAFVLPALARLYQKLEQKKLERERQQAQERRQLEMLRTGRDPDAEERARAEQQMAMATAQVAAQRQAQLAELRRRQQERLRQAAAARAATPGVSGTARPQLPTVQRPQPSPARPPAPSGPRPVRRQTSSRPGVRPARGAARGRGQLPTAPPVEIEPSEGPAHPLGIELGTSISQRSLATQLSSAPAEVEPSPAGAGMTAAPGRGRVPTVVLGQGLGIEDWRRAFVMQEILGRPVGLREGASE